MKISVGLKERRQREKEERREQILAAARTLLLSQGIQATSVAQIAKKAELGVGTIYFYYKSKEEIFAALQEEGLDILYDRIRAVVDTGTAPSEKLRQAALAYLDFSTRHKDYFDIIHYFLAAGQVILAPNLKNRVDMHGGRILALIAEIIIEGMDTEGFRTVDPRKTALTFWASLQGLLQLRKFDATLLLGYSHGDIFSYAVNQFCDGLR